MPIDWTNILVGALGAGGVVTALLKHRYDMKKLTLQHEEDNDKAIYEAVTKERESLLMSHNSECERLHAQILESVKSGRPQLSEDGNKNLAKAKDIIYSNLWHLLFQFKFDRTYILQAHPKENSVMLSVLYEAKSEGVSSVIETHNNLEIAKYKSFARMLSSNDFMAIEDLVSSDIDCNIKSILENSGSKALFMCRLLDIDDNWVGTIIADSFEPRSDIDIDVLKTNMRAKARKIRNIVPDILTIK